MSEMLPATGGDIVSFPSTLPPQLICVIDAEEEFDWNAPFASSNSAVETIKAQAAAQTIYRRFGLIPTYAVDYPVASQSDGFRPLRKFADNGQCEIGAQLHPWVTPPHEEIVNEKNSFACNLLYDLHRRKMEALTAAIRQNFDIEPKLFRTGRYGAGRDTVHLLREFGYDIDCSVLPGPPITPSSPDYSHAPVRPYWLDPKRAILEIPVTAGTIGSLRGFRHAKCLEGRRTFNKWTRLPAILGRLHLLKRVRISPEGQSLSEAKKLTRTLLRAGQRVFAMSYHSPSLVPAKTPYTRTTEDVERFLGWIENYLEFFMAELGGGPSTPRLVRRLAIRSLSTREGDDVEGGPA